MIVGKHWKKNLLFEWMKSESRESKRFPQFKYFPWGLRVRYLCLSCSSTATLPWSRNAGDSVTLCELKPVTGGYLPSRVEVHVLPLEAPPSQSIFYRCHSRLFRCCCTSLMFCFCRPASLFLFPLSRLWIISYFRLRSRTTRRASDCAI